MHIPIVVQFIPAIVAETSYKNIENLRLKLKITPPKEFISKGSELPIKCPMIIEVPPSGLVKLKLIASDTFVVKGRYTVETLITGQDFPIDVQYWIVPSRKLTPQSVVGFGSAPLQLPQNAYAITNINYDSGDWEIQDGNLLVWLSNPPTKGYVVKYEPGLVACDLIANL